MKKELCFRKQSIQLLKHQPSEAHTFNYEGLILLSILFLTNLTNGLVTLFTTLAFHLSSHWTPVLYYRPSFWGGNSSSLASHSHPHYELLGYFFLDRHHQLNAFLPITETMTPLRTWQLEYSPVLQLSVVINSLIVFSNVFFFFYLYHFNSTVIPFKKSIFNLIPFTAYKPTWYKENFSFAPETRLFKSCSFCKDDFL